MKKNDKWIFIGALILVLVVVVLMIVFSPFANNNNKKAKNTPTSEKTTLEDLVVSSSEKQNQSDVSATPIESVIISDTKDVENNKEYPAGYEDIWRIDSDGNQYLIINGSVEYREDLEAYNDPETIMKEAEKEVNIGAWGMAENEDEYKALYPVTIYMSGYPVNGTFFTDDVIPAMSIAVLELQHERFQPWLVEQGFEGDLYLLYSHTKTYDVKLNPQKHGINESLFYVLDKESFDKWNETQDMELLKNRQEIWVIFNEWDGKLEFELK